MGIITNLIHMNEDKKRKDRMDQINNWQSILALPDDVMPKETKNWAAQNLSGVLGEGLGLKKKDHGIVHGLLSSISGLNPNPSPEAPPAGAPPAFKPVSPEQGAQIRTNRLQESTLATGRANATLDQEGQNRTEKTIQELEQKGQISKEQAAEARLQTTVPGYKPERTGAGTGAGAAPSADVIAARTRIADQLNLTGDTRTDYIATAKLPTGFGKTPTPTRQTDNDIAFESYAAKKGKKTQDLTPAEKVTAIRDFKAGTKVGEGGSSGSGSGRSIAERSKAAYVPNGPSIANPGGKDLAVEGMAWAYITTNHMPFTGMGGGKKGGENKREVAVARAGEILANLGIGWEELPGLQANIKANAKALGTITSMGHTMSQFENTVTRNMDLAQQLSSKFSRTSSPFLNRIQGGIQRQTGDQAVDNFNLQMRTLAQEYAKVMAGSTSASGVRITDSEEATKLINGFIGDKNLSGLFEVMNKDMENRRAAVAQEKDGIVAEIRKPTQGFGKSADQPAATGGGSGGSKPAAKKADYRWENGKLIKN